VANSVACLVLCCAVPCRAVLCRDGAGTTAEQPIIQAVNCCRQSVCKQL
jgi:hypothetical protein